MKHKIEMGYWKTLSGILVCDRNVFHKNPRSQLEPESYMACWVKPVLPKHPSPRCGSCLAVVQYGGFSQVLTMTARPERPAPPVGKGWAKVRGAWLSLADVRKGTVCDNGKTETAEKDSCGKQRKASPSYSQRQCHHHWVRFPSLFPHANRH